MALIRVNNTLPSLMEGFLGRDFNQVFGTESTHAVPAVNVFETKDSFRLEVAAPGLKKEDFKLNIDRNQLTISSEVANTTDETEGKYVRKEFSFQTFQRRFTLPQTVDTDKISASYTNGVLSVSLPKREEAKPKPFRQIEIS